MFIVIQLTGWRSAPRAPRPDFIAGYDGDGVPFVSVTKYREAR